MMKYSWYILLLWLPLCSVSGFSCKASTLRRCPSPSKLSAVRESTFGMGCFWEPSEALLKVDGVVDTIVGYTGNPSATDKAPTYDSVCFGNQWVEGVRVKYDDDKLSYQELLEAFFKSQKPKIGSRQYASIIFPHDEEQTQIANDWIQTNANRQRDEDGFMASWTAIEPRTKFFKAEGYHQRYWQKQRPRFALIVCLLAIATGALNSVVPDVYQQTVETAANASVLLIAAVQLLERVLDAKVEEI
eukprot:scaffold22589_cov138-Cylindrotheca_fusiformis.AAC.3